MAEELSNELWPYRTTPWRSTRETHFSMAYKTKVVIPMEIGLSSMRVSDFSPDNDDDRMAKQLDLLEERREMALIRLADY